MRSAGFLRRKCGGTRLRDPLRIGAGSSCSVQKVFKARKLPGGFEVQRPVSLRVPLPFCTSHGATRPTGRRSLGGRRRQQHGFADGETAQHFYPVAGHRFAQGDKAASQLAFGPDRGDEIELADPAYCGRRHQ